MDKRLKAFEAREVVERESEIDLLMVKLQQVVEIVEEVRVFT